MNACTSWSQHMVGFSDFRRRRFGEFCCKQVPLCTWLMFGAFLLAEVWWFLPGTGSYLQLGFGWQNNLGPKTVWDNYFLSHTGRAWISLLIFVVNETLMLKAVDNFPVEKFILHCQFLHAMYSGYISVWECLPPVQMSSFLLSYVPNNILALVTGSKYGLQLLLLLLLLLLPNTQEA